MIDLLVASMIGIIYYLFGLFITALLTGYKKETSEGWIYLTALLWPLLIIIFIITVIIAHPTKVKRLIIKILIIKPLKAIFTNKISLLIYDVILYIPVKILTFGNTVSEKVGLKYL